MAQGSNKKIVFAVVGLGAVALVVALVMYTSGSDSLPPATPESQGVAEDASDLDETTPVAERRRPTGGEGAGSPRLAADSSDQADMDAGEGEAKQVQKRKGRNTKRNKKRRKSGDAEADEEDGAAAPPKKPSRRPIKAP